MEEKKQDLWVIWNVERYSYNKKTEAKEHVQGCTITVSALTPEKDSTNFKGLRMMQMRIPYEGYDQFVVLPALYEIQTRTVPDWKGNPTTKFVSATLVKDEKFEGEFK